MWSIQSNEAPFDWDKEHQRSDMEFDYFKLGFEFE